MRYGVSVPWNLVCSAAIGFFIMATPSLLTFEGPLADADHVLGALVVTISVISMAEVVRAGRYINVLFGVLLLLTSLIVGDRTVPVILTHIVISGLLVALSFRRGKILETYGSWNRLIK